MNATTWFHPSVSLFRPSFQTNPGQPFPSPGDGADNVIQEGDMLLVPPLAATEERHALSGFSAFFFLCFFPPARWISEFSRWGWRLTLSILPVSLSLSLEVAKSRLFDSFSSVSKTFPSSLPNSPRRPQSQRDHSSSWSSTRSREIQPSSGHRSLNDEAREDWGRDPRRMSSDDGQRGFEGIDLLASYRGLRSLSWYSHRHDQSSKM